MNSRYNTCSGSWWADRNVEMTSLQTLLRRKVTGEKEPATELEPGAYTLSRSFSHMSYWSQSQILRLPFQRYYLFTKNLNKHGEKEAVTPSTTGSWVHATCCHPLSPLPPHTVPASRCRSSSSCCIAAHLRPIHKTMGDEGFAAGTDSSCGWSSAKECRSQFKLGRWSFFSCHLSPE